MSSQAGLECGKQVQLPDIEHRSLYLFLIYRSPGHIKTTSAHHKSIILLNN